MKYFLNTAIIALTFWTILTIDGAGINHLFLEALGFFVLGFFRIYHREFWDYLTKVQ